MFAKLPRSKFRSDPLVPEVFVLPTPPPDRMPPTVVPRLPRSDAIFAPISCIEARRVDLSVRDTTVDGIFLVGSSALEAVRRAVNKSSESFLQL
jgi:hypothetical protein